jgi:ADP-heptose:LPS heptosyltransferase
MAGLINNCGLIVANDSGPMHIAAALGVPTLGLFGPTNPQMHGPYAENSCYVIKKDLFCIICNKTECPYKHECFINMDVNNVVDKAGTLMLIISPPA